NLLSMRRVDHLRVELDAHDAGVAGESRQWGVGAAGQRMEARRQLGDVVAVAHPDRHLGGQAREEVPGVLHLDEGGSVFAVVGGQDLAAEVVSDQLHAVADPEHGDAGLERGRVDLGGAAVIDAGRAAAQDQAGRLPVLQLRPGNGAQYQLAVDACLADAPGDQLRVLGAEVEDEDRRARGRRLDRRAHFPMPTRWACWKTLPSLTMAGAITISTRWNARRSRAPQTPSAERSAPAKFWVPSSTRAGPARISRSVAFTPTSIRVPRGRLGSGVAMPQLNPLEADSSAPARGDPTITASAPHAKALQTSAPIRMPPSVITATLRPVRS